MRYLAWLRSSAVISLFLGIQVPLSAQAKRTVGPATNRADILHGLRDARSAFAAGDLPAAEANFARVIKLAPNLLEAHAGLGATLLREGKPADAVRELEIAGRARDVLPETLLELSAAYSDLREYARSVDFYRAYGAMPDAASTPLPAELAVPIATALQQAGDAQTAQQVLEVGLISAASSGLVPARARGALRQAARLEDALGAVLAAGNHMPEAEAHLQRAVLDDPSLALAHFHLGSLRMAQGATAEAVPELRRAAELEPAVSGYRLQLARGLLANGEADKAAQEMKALLGGRPALSPADALEARYQLGLAEQTLGHSAEALALLREVAKARPDDVSVLTNAGLAEMQVGHAPEAIALYQHGLLLAPDSVTLHENLGAAYLQQNDLAHALEQFRNGLAADPENPMLHYDLGLALKLKDDLAGAVPEFERAAALNPLLPDPPYTLGVIYMQQGRFADAARSLEQHLALRPENGDAWSTLGSVYRQMDQPDKAVEALNKAIALVPDQPSPHITLATILAARGDRAGAARERKLGADLTRVAVNRQKASFALDSANLLTKRGQTAEAMAQYRNAVEADPAYAAAHLALADALERSGDKAGAQVERAKASQVK